MSSLLTTGAALLLLAAVHPAARAKERAPAPLYTNADLDRLSRFRSETGVSSVPASPAPLPTATRPEKGDERKTEAYWRDRARQLRDRLATLRDRADDLRVRLEERRRALQERPLGGPRGRARLPSGDSGLVLLERQLERTEGRIREAEADFLDEARRAGALPGWLR